MAKSYPEQLAEWVKRRESTKRDKNLVAFLAVRGDIQMAIEAGYAVKTIWANMHEERRVAFGYDTFLNYVNRHLRGKVSKPANLLASPVIRPSPIAATTVAHAPVATTRSEPQIKPHAPASGFTYNPQPNTKDLI